MSDASVGDLIQELQIVLSEKRSDYVEAAERTLEKIVQLNDPSSVSQLVRCFDDNEQYDELMFSIVHSIEIFDDATYARELVSTLPSFIQNAPRWCSIVHMRVLNSPSALTAYINEIKSVDDETKNILRKMIVQMGARGAQIAEKTVPLLKALN